MKDKVLDFLKTKELMVISSINNQGNPQSAVVGFTEMHDLSIIFATSNSTRKYSNILSNPNVSLVIGWDLEEKKTVQYEGTAKKVSAEELNSIKQLHTTKSSKRKKYADNPQNIYFKITPKWIRYSNLAKSPEEIFTITF